MKARNTLACIPAALALSLCLAAPAKADYYADALTTYQHGEYRDAFVMFDKLAKQGDARAQFWIGTMWYEGKGKPQNYLEAYRSYLRSAYLGNSDSQNNLGLIYEKGQVQPANPVVAYAWYALAAAQNDGQSSTIANDNLTRLSDSLKQAGHDKEIIEGQALAQEYSLRIHVERQAQRKIDLASAPGTATPSPGSMDVKVHPAAALTPHRLGEFYKVQIGLFGQSENIKGVRAELDKLGLGFEDKVVEVQGNSYHRFRIGPYGTIRAAEAAARKVNGEFHLQSAIIPLLK